MKRIICFVVAITLFASTSVFALEPDSYTFFGYFKFNAEKEITSEITSVTIRKVNTELWHDVRKTTDKEQLAKFTELAKTITLKKADVNDAPIPWGEGMYIEVAFDDYVSYSFISADGGVDDYSIFMSRLPIRAYQFDVPGNSYRMISEFFEGLDNNTSDLAAVADDWAIEDIAKAIELGILPEHLQNDYKAFTTRERFCEVINGMIQLQGFVISVKPSELLEYGFDDCKNPAVVYLHNLGIVFGKGNGIFDPDGLLTRQEAATILYRLMQQYNLKNETTNPKTAFGDSDQIAGWALEGVKAVYASGIMNGDGTNFMPKQKFSHQQAIATIMRVYNGIVADREPIDFTAKIVRTNGGADGTNYPVITTINSFEELSRYYEKYKDIYSLISRKPYDIGFLDATAKYDDAFFKESSGQPPKMYTGGELG